MRVSEYIIEYKSPVTLGKWSKLASWNNLEYAEQDFNTVVTNNENQYIKYRLVKIKVIREA